MDPRVSFYNNLYNTQQPPEINKSFFQLGHKNSSFAAIKFISECSKKLDVRPSTFACAASIFHRVNKNLLKKDYDRFTIATGAIYLASKVNEDPVRLKDIINVSQTTLDKEEALNNLGNDSWILSIRDTIVQCELFIMRVLHFDPSVKLPHPYLLNYLNTLENWLDDSTISETPIAKCSISLLEDFYSNPAIVEFEPEHIAVGVIALTFQIYGIKIPGLESEVDNWFKAFCPELTIDVVWDVIDQILKVYEAEAELQL